MSVPMKRSLFFLVLMVAALFAEDPPRGPARERGGTLSPHPVARRPARLPSALHPLHAFIEAPPNALIAIEKGTAWLSQNQNPDGSFGDEYPVAVTSLAGLAMMGEGSHLARGTYSRDVGDALAYLLRRQWRSGLIAEERGKMMHSHGYATLFLAEIYGMSSADPAVGVDDLKDRLKRAIRVIESSQSHNGGWYYDPIPSYDEGSVTVTVVQALRAARNAGIRVNRRTVEKAFEYIKLSSVEDGGITYSLGNTSSSFALTAAGVSVLNYLGEYGGKEVEKGLAYLGRGFARPDETGKGNFPYYEDFYAALTMYHAGGEYWSEYYPMIRDAMIRRQNDDGSWDSSYGKSYGTALALLTLQIPCRYLSIFQR